MTRLWLCLALAGCANAPTVSEPPPARHPAPVVPVAKEQPAAVDEEAIDDAVESAIARKEAPGAVIAVVRDGAIIWQKAYGLRARGEPMTEDTLFDLASLTKPIVTATAVMLLVDDGKLTLDDAVAHHLPAFAQHGKERITVRQLLEHTSGLTAANPLGDYRGSRARAIERLLALPLAHPPGRRVYSDVGYIVLGELVAKLSGTSLDRFAERRIFEPLGMRATFTPDAARAAPTEGDLRGRVHDPRAAALGGVAGHAGTFATAADVATFAAIFLDKKQRLLSAASLIALKAAHPSVDGGFGHTGFTGTSYWLEPRSGVGVVLLTSRLHPGGKGDVTRLRRELRAIMLRASPVLTGIDVLVAEDMAPLRGRRVGLVTNATGRTRNGRSTIETMRSSGVALVALFSPEHGIAGELDAAVPDTKDGATPIYSLYGKNPRPTRAQLRGIDTLVFDVQDAGARFYTYITTLGYLLEAAAQHRIRVVVLDRPNLVGGALVEGPLLDRDRESFIGYHPLPVRHGMTVGELAKLYNAERRIGADLQVIAMRGYRRDQLFDDTRVPWVNPSPNLRSAHAALLYPGIGMLEATSLSVGRGTDRPFEQIGAPWLDGERLARALRRADVRVTPVRFTPSSSTFAGRACQGVAFEVLDRPRFESVAFGIAVAHAIHQLNPREWRADRMITHLGNRRAHEALLRGDSPAAIEHSWQEDLAAFRAVRARYLLY